MNTVQKQCLLRYLGYYKGAVDGAWGNGSQSALEWFQRETSITVDGIWGEQTETRILEAVYMDEFAPEPPAEVAPDKTDADTGIPAWWKNIKYFRREEFRCPCGKCGGYPVEPQEGLVTEVDSLRGAVGLPVIVVPPDGHSGGSGVRCHAYNATLKGSVSNSRHLYGKAADFCAPGVPASAIEAYLTRRKAAGKIRYWYRISPGSYHMDIE